MAFYINFYALIQGHYIDWCYGEEKFTGKPVNNNILKYYQKEFVKIQEKN
jgi:hypothetical protein